MKSILKIITLFIAVILPIMTSLSANEIKTKKPASIPKAFIKSCEKKSIENPFSDMLAIVDSKGKLKCKGFVKYRKPKCPDDYEVVKRKCVKIAQKKSK